MIARLISTPANASALEHDRKALARRIIAIEVVAVAAIGLVWAARPQLSGVWWLWSADGLRSAGMIIPPVSAFLCWRAWREIKWDESNPFGLLLAIAVLIAARSTRDSNFVVAATPALKASILPIGVLLFAYVSGVVLFFGGLKAYRAAFLPIFLLLFVVPVPSFLGTLLDLRLQYLAAHAARNFAGLIGLKLNGDQLTLMFWSSSSGMFIAPGCDGMRGAVAMGLIALVAGYLLRLSKVAHLTYVIGAMLAAYLLNFVRLCALVLCYRMAPAVPSLAIHMEGVDYAIGAALFGIAAAGLFVAAKAVAPCTLER